MAPYDIVWKSFHSRRATRVCRRSGRRVGQMAEEIFEPAQQFGETAEKRCYQQNKFRFRHYLLIKKYKAPKKIFVDFLRPECLSNLREASFTFIRETWNLT